MMTENFQSLEKETDESEKSMEHQITWMGRVLYHGT